MTLKDLGEAFQTDLCDPKFIELYLGFALEDGPEAFLSALRDVIQANEGMTQIAQRTALGRESLYKALSEKGNPHWKTVYTVLDALGLRLSVARAA